MSKIEVLEFTQEDQKDEWDKFVNDSYSGDILSYWGWGETKKDQGWKPLRIGVTRDGVLILTALCLLKKASFLGNYLYIGHGPVFKNKIDLKEALPYLILYLKGKAKEYKLFTIDIEPRFGDLAPEEQKERLSENLVPLVDGEIKKILILAGFKTTRRNMQPVYKLYYDLGRTEDELKADMKKSTRYNIGLAERKGVEVNEYKASDDSILEKIDSFYDLMEEVQRRAKGYPMRPKSSFIRLFKEFKNNDCLSLFETKYNGELISINISQKTNYWSSSFYAGSNRLYTEVKAPYLMRWKSVLSAKAYGSKVYDFWGIIPNSKQHQGYSDNKLSYGGVRINNYGIFTYTLNGFKSLIWELTIKIRKIIYRI